MANRDVNPSQGFAFTGGDAGDWNAEETYWRDNWSTRPYAQADRGFDYYRPGYRYGYESAHMYRGREWNDVEHELASGWDRFADRGERTWERTKDAVRDAWDRVRRH